MRGKPVLLVVLKVALPVVVLVGAVGLAMLIATLRPVPPAAEARPVVAPIVEVLEVRTVSAGRLVVESQGTVEPRRRTTLATQVGGRVEYVSPQLVRGGTFDAGDVLVRIEDEDFRQALAQARDALAAAELALELERHEAEVAVREWERLRRNGEVPDLVARRPQLAARRATVSAAEEALARAERDVTRTLVQAPYAGRVASKEVDAGEVVQPGQSLARLFATDAAEVRLPIPLAEAALLDLPWESRDDDDDAAAGPEVTLRISGLRHGPRWRGRIVRTEGQLDPRTRTLTAVARIDQPGEPAEPGIGLLTQVPLLDGMFVEAEIVGRSVERVQVLPRAAVRDGNRVLVVHPDDNDTNDATELINARDDLYGGRLELRTVDVLRRTTNTVIVHGGLADGEWVIVSPVATPIDSMPVRARYEGETPVRLGPDGGR